jgi:hypothetical protein
MEGQAVGRENLINIPKALNLGIFAENWQKWEVLAPFGPKSLYLSLFQSTFLQHFLLDIRNRIKIRIPVGRASETGNQLRVALLNIFKPSC